MIVTARAPPRKLANAAAAAAGSRSIAGRTYGAATHRRTHRGNPGQAPPRVETPAKHWHQCRSMHLWVPSAGCQARPHHRRHVAPAPAGGGPPSSPPPPDSERRTASRAAAGGQAGVIGVVVACMGEVRPTLNPPPLPGSRALISPTVPYSSADPSFRQSNRTAIRGMSGGGGRGGRMPPLGPDHPARRTPVHASVSDSGVGMRRGVGRKRGR